MVSIRKVAEQDVGFFGKWFKILALVV